MFEDQGTSSGKTDSFLLENVVLLQKTSRIFSEGAIIWGRMEKYEAKAQKKWNIKNRINSSAAFEDDKRVSLSIQANHISVFIRKSQNDWWLALEINHELQHIIWSLWGLKILWGVHADLSL